VKRLSLLLLVALFPVAAQAAPRLSLHDLRRAGVLPAGCRRFPRRRPRPGLEVRGRDALRVLDVRPVGDAAEEPPGPGEPAGGVVQTVYVFVADSVWGAKAVQSDVDAIVQAFDVATPRHADQGITAAEAGAVRETPPDVDGDRAA